jgi:hypothetical protein
MPQSISDLVLRAKALEAQALQHMAARVDLVDVAGQLIHALQTVRGATSIHLASQGLRFGPERQQALDEAAPINAALRALIARQLRPDQGPTPRMLSLMAWVLMDLDDLAALDAQIDMRQLSAHDAVAAYSRVIAGLVELVFHIADAADDPGVSRLLIAFVHLIQGKEAAGQERAVGAQLFASGACDEAEQQRIVHLIDAQEHSLNVFADLAGPDLRERWLQHQLSPLTAQLERLRRTLCSARQGAVLDTALSDNWFEVCSARITEMGRFQAEVVGELRQACAGRIRAAAQDLQDAEGLLQRLRMNPPPHTDAVKQFFSTAMPNEGAPMLQTGTDGRPAPAAETGADADTLASLKAVMQAQSRRLSDMEVELDAARRALHERKVIERAKGALMSRMGLTEEAAFRTLQKAAMDHNKRLLDVAEAALALPEAAFGRRSAG